MKWIKEMWKKVVVNWKVRRAQKQLAMIPSDPNMTIVTGPHFDWSDFAVPKELLTGKEELGDDKEDSYEEKLVLDDDDVV